MYNIFDIIRLVLEEIENIFNRFSVARNRGENAVFLIFAPNIPLVLILMDAAKLCPLQICICDLNYILCLCFVSKVENKI